MIFKADIAKKIYRALHTIDPNLSIKEIDRIKIQTWENHLGSEFEEDFIFNKVPKLVHPFWVQLLESQRELESILKFATKSEDEVEKFLNGTVNIFNNQLVDFSIEFPYEIFNQRGLIIEIDGKQHEEEAQKITDDNRDNATEKAKWKRAVRIKTTDWSKIKEKLTFLKDLEQEEYFSIIKENYDSPLHKDNDGFIALQLALTPILISRIQKSIIHLLVTNQLNLSKEVLNIAVIENDITGSKIAIEDLFETFGNLIKLSNENLSLPKINIFVENSSVFKKSPLYSGKTIDKSIEYDLLIDVSVLKRQLFKVNDDSIKSKLFIQIHSSHSPKSRRNFLTSDLILYKPLGKKNRKNNEFIENHNQVKLLEKFVQDIFRKKGFRPGQVEILNRALQTKSVIGLLPTGSGKSLTYQLAVLLQPGLSIVVDPIKSLMKDQYEGLLNNKIDCCVYINSSLNQKERQLAIKKINNAGVLFAFVSPERLQDDVFRKQLIETSQINKNYFSYCIIDEAHCVSEWGARF